MILAALVQAAGPDTLIHKILRDPEPARGITLFGSRITWEAVAATGQILSAGFAALAFFAAWKAANAAYESIKEQRNLQVNQARGLYYRKLIADPAAAIVETFVTTALETIRDTADRVATARAAGQPYNAGRIPLREGITAFTRAHLEMTEALVRRVESWPDPDLREVVRKASEQVQDHLLALFPKVLGDPADARVLRSALYGETGALLRTLMSSDPSATAGDSGPAA